MVPRRRGAAAVSDASSLLCSPACAATDSFSIVIASVRRLIQVQVARGRVVAGPSPISRARCASLALRLPPFAFIIYQCDPRLVSHCRFSQSPTRNSQCDAPYMYSVPYFSQTRTWLLRLRAMCASSRAERALHRAAKSPHVRNFGVLIGLIGLIESPSSDATGAGLSLLA